MMIVSYEQAKKKLAKSMVPDNESGERLLEQGSYQQRHVLEEPPGTKIIHA